MKEQNIKISSIFSRNQFSKQDFNGLDANVNEIQNKQTNQKYIVSFSSKQNSSIHELRRKNFHFFLFATMFICTFTNKKTKIIIIQKKPKKKLLCYLRFVHELYCETFALEYP